MFQGERKLEEVGIGRSASSQERRRNSTGHGHSLFWAGGSGTQHMSFLLAHIPSEELWPFDRLRRVGVGEGNPAYLR